MGNCLGVCTASDDDVNAKRVPSSPAKNVPSSPVPTCADSVDCHNTAVTAGLTVSVDVTPINSAPNTAGTDEYSGNVLSPGNVLHDDASRADISDTTDVTPLPVRTSHTSHTDDVINASDIEEEGENNGNYGNNENNENDENNGNDENGENSPILDESMNNSEEGNTEICPNFEINHHQLTRISYKAKVDWWHSEIDNGNRCGVCWLRQYECFCKVLSARKEHYESIKALKNVKDQELGRSANTAHLFEAICPSNSYERVVFGDTQAEIGLVQDIIDENNRGMPVTCVLYPSKDAILLSEWIKQRPAAIRDLPIRLVALDGTYGQANRQWKYLTHALDLLSTKTKIQKESFLRSLNGEGEIGASDNSDRGGNNKKVSNNSNIDNNSEFSSIIDFLPSNLRTTKKQQKIEQIVEPETVEKIEPKIQKSARNSEFSTFFNYIDTAPTTPTTPKVAEITKITEIITEIEEKPLFSASNMMRLPVVKLDLELGGCDSIVAGIMHQPGKDKICTYQALILAIQQSGEDPEICASLSSELELWISHILTRKIKFGKTKIRKTDDFGATPADFVLKFLADNPPPTGPKQQKKGKEEHNERNGNNESDTNSTNYDSKTPKKTEKKEKILKDIHGIHSDRSMKSERSEGSDKKCSTDKLDKYDKSDKGERNVVVIPHSVWKDTNTTGRTPSKKDVKSLPTYDPTATL